MRTFLGSLGLFRPSPAERVASFLVRCMILAIAIWAAAALIPGIHLRGWQSTAIVALVLGAVNALLGPFLRTLTLPLTLITFGLFSIVINALLLWLTGRIAAQFPQLFFSIDRFFWDAVLGAIVIAAVTWLVGRVVHAGRIGRSF